MDCISLTTARVVLFTRLRPVLVPTFEVENVFIWISECWSNFPGSLSFCTRPSVASLMCFILVWFMEYFPQPWHALLDKVSLLLHSCFVLTVAYKRRPFKCWRHNMYFKVASCACRQIFPAFSYSGLTGMTSLSSGCILSFSPITLAKYSLLLLWNVCARLNRGFTHSLLWVC